MKSIMYDKKNNINNNTLYLEYVDITKKICFQNGNFIPLADFD